MKKLEKLAAKKGYTLSFSDRSGNWIGGHRRGCFIKIKGRGFEKEVTSIRDAVEFLS